MKLPFKLTTTILVDVLILAAVLVGLNVWLAPKDVGWVRINPSPYLLLPLLLGGRFGFGPGVVAGVLAAAIVVAGQLGTDQLALKGLVSNQKFLLASLVLTGALAGEIQHFFQGRLARAETLQDDFQHRVKQLDAELYFLRQAKSELDMIVATRDAELWTLDNEIRELYQSSSRDFYQKLLQVLQRQAQISDGAIYAVGEQNLTREAVAGRDDLLPRQLRPGEVEMISLALERKTAVTIPELWNRDYSHHRNYLIALPILSADETVRAMVVITGMPFFSLNQKTVHLISVITRWAAKVLDTQNSAGNRFRLSDGSDVHRVFSPEVLRRNIELAFHSYHSHRLPSALALFTLPSASAGAQPDLERTLLPLVRAADCPAQFDWSFPNLAILLPLTGERAALTVVNRMVEAFPVDSPYGRLDHRLYPFDQTPSAEQLWRELNQLADAAPLQQS